MPLLIVLTVLALWFVGITPVMVFYLVLAAIWVFMFVALAAFNYPFSLIFAGLTLMCFAIA